VKEYIATKDNDLQFVELYNPGVNTVVDGCKAKTKPTIETQCTIIPAHPIQLRDKVRPQIKVTLNILQTSQISSTKLAYEALNGQKE
jgi:hypothetical protein